MLGINLDAALAFHNKWAFCRSNTRVVWADKSKISHLLLHGNCIASLDHNDGTITVDHCGWKTNTTKTRLNAVLERFKYKISQRKGVWYLVDSKGGEIEFSEAKTLK